jgi:hypothetical protein
MLLLAEPKTADAPASAEKPSTPEEKGASAKAEG